MLEYDYDVPENEPYGTKGNPHILNRAIIGVTATEGLAIEFIRKLRAITINTCVDLAREVGNGEKYSAKYSKLDGEEQAFNDTCELVTEKIAEALLTLKQGED